MVVHYSRKFKLTFANPNQVKIFRHTLSELNDVIEIINIHKSIGWKVWCLNALKQDQIDDKIRLTIIYTERD